jgi:hypothetical protein
MIPVHIPILSFPHLISTFLIPYTSHIHHTIKIRSSLPYIDFPPYLVPAPDLMRSFICLLTGVVSGFWVFRVYRYDLDYFD